MVVAVARFTQRAKKKRQHKHANCVQNLFELRKRASSVLMRDFHRNLLLLWVRRNQLNRTRVCVTVYVNRSPPVRRATVSRGIDRSIDFVDTFYFRSDRGGHASQNVHI